MTDHPLTVKAPRGKGVRTRRQLRALRLRVEAQRHPKPERRVRVHEKVDAR